MEINKNKIGENHKLIVLKIDDTCTMCKVSKDTNVEDFVEQKIDEAVQNITQKYKKEGYNEAVCISVGLLTTLQMHDDLIVEVYELVHIKTSYRYLCYAYIISNINYLYIF